MSIAPPPPASSLRWRQGGAGHDLVRRPVVADLAGEPELRLADQPLLHHPVERPGCLRRSAGSRRRRRPGRAASASSTIAWPARTEIANGFSMRTCLPAARRVERDLVVEPDRRQDEHGIDLVVGQHPPPVVVEVRQGVGIEVADVDVRRGERIARVAGDRRPWGRPFAGPAESGRVLDPSRAEGRDPDSVVARLPATPAAPQVGRQDPGAADDAEPDRRRRRRDGTVDRPIVPQAHARSTLPR